MVISYYHVIFACYIPKKLQFKSSLSAESAEAIAEKVGHYLHTMSLSDSSENTRV